MLTISPDLGRRPCHLGIACARSTYAAFVTVPRMTASVTSWLWYLPPANVPILSFTCIIHNKTKIAVNRMQYQGTQDKHNIYQTVIHPPKSLTGKIYAWPLEVGENGLTKAATRISRPIFSMDLVNSPTTSCPTYINGSQERN